MNDGKSFEDEVRRIARLLWPAAEFGGAAMEDGHERDGVFETEEFVHVIECTTSRSQQKAKDDLEKLQKIIRKIGAKYSHKFLKGWFITAEEPTADQRAVFRGVQGRVVAVSFDQFRSRLIDARSYLSARDNYPFGSVRDPETGAARAEIGYVPLDIVGRDGTQYSVEAICKDLLDGQRFVMLGDYGAGKSSTLREMFLTASHLFRAGASLMFPIALNLRDHHGQVDPVEVLERHARRVGFARPPDLVRAWRGGFGLLLLDGFDEIATAGWAGKTKTLKELRYRSMELVRSFLRDTPQSSGIVVAGRAHFFDSPREMIESLGIGGNAKVLNLSEFNEEQIRTYLSKQGWDAPIPGWIPARPLLLGYLASRQLLSATLEVDAASGPAVGWDALLQKICEREAEIEAGIDPDAVRRLLGRLATLARNTADGLGPVSAEQITKAFEFVCGYPPDDRGAVLVQRLPGLGGHSAEDGSRVFIDKDFADSALGGAVSDFVENPYSQYLESKDWQNAVCPLAAQVAALRASRTPVSSGQFTAAVHHVQGLPKSDTLCADLILTMLAGATTYSGSDVFVRDVIVPDLILDDLSSDLSAVCFQDCIFGHLDFHSDVNLQQAPRFLRCYFGLVSGRTGADDMRIDIFSECTFDEFEDSAQTTNDILRLDLPLLTKVLLTILKKLFAQRGSGRRESALYRGLDPRSRDLVPEALALLKKHGFVFRTRQRDHVVWLPPKSSDYRRRALAILAAPITAADPLLTETLNS
jgi:hypothetical protein